MKQQQGLSLLEIMLVIAIAAAILLSGALQYKRMQWNRDLETLRASMGLAKQALNSYYFQNADYFNASQSRNPNIQLPHYLTVVSALPESIRGSIRNPWGLAIEPFQFKVSCSLVTENIDTKTCSETNTCIQHCVCSVRTRILQHNFGIAGIARMLGADVVKGSNTDIIWSYIPDMMPKNFSPKLWVIENTMHSFKNSLYQLVNPKS